MFAEFHPQSNNWQGLEGEMVNYPETFQERFKTLIATKNLSVVIDNLLKTNFSGESKKYVLSYAARHNNFRTMNMKGTISLTDGLNIQNEITREIIEFIDNVAEGKLPRFLGSIKGITLVLDGNLEQFNDQQKIALLESILRLLSADSYIIIRKITRGSIRVSIDLPEAKAKELRGLIKTGELLAGYRVQNVIFSRGMINVGIVWKRISPMVFNIVKILAMVILVVILFFLMLIRITQ